eukprot:gene9569-19883_t
MTITTTLRSIRADFKCLDNSLGIFLQFSIVVDEGTGDTLRRLSNCSKQNMGIKLRLSDWKVKMIVNFYYYLYSEIFSIGILDPGTTGNFEITILNTNELIHSKKIRRQGRCESGQEKEQLFFILDDFLRKHGML